MDVLVPVADLRGIDDDLVAVFQVDGHFLEIRSSDHIFRRSQPQRIKTGRTEDVPGGHFSVVFIAGVSLSDFAADVKPGQDLPHLLLGFPGLAGIIVHVKNVMGGLIAVGVHAHPDIPGFPHLVDGTAVMPLKLRQGRLRCAEELIQLGGQRLPSPVKIGQSLAVLRGVKGHVPGIGLRIIPSPLAGIKVFG